MDTNLKTPDFKLKIGPYDFSVPPLKNYVSQIEVDQLANGISSFKVFIDDNDNIFSVPVPLPENGQLIDIKEGMETSVELGYVEDGTELVIQGLVTSMKTQRRNGARVYFVVSGFDGLQKLTRGRRRRSWEQIKDSDLASQIAGENGLGSDIEDTQIVMPYVVQNNVTDLTFLFERAKLYGYEVKVDKDNKLVFKKPDYGTFLEKLHYEEPKWRKEGGVLMAEINVSTSTMNVVQKVVVRWYDPKKAEPLIATSGDKAYGDVLVGSDNGRGIAIAPVNNPDTTKQYNTIPFYCQEEGELLAKSLLNDLDSGYVTGKGKCQGTTKVHARGYVELLEIGDKLTGKYYVTEAKHVLKVGGGDGYGYWTDFHVCKTGHDKP